MAILWREKCHEDPITYLSFRSSVTLQARFRFPDSADGLDQQLCPGTASCPAHGVRRACRARLLTVSPDGKAIAYTAPSPQGVANIWVEDLSTHKKRMVTRAGHRGIGGYQWAYDNNHLLYQSDENGNEDEHFYSVDLASGAIRDLTPFLGVRAEQTLLMPSHPDEVLVSMNLRDPKCLMFTGYIYRPAQL
jgi:hypothetical protein